MDADDVLRNADAAMYRAKYGGKDPIELFEHGLRTDHVTGTTYVMDGGLMRNVSQGA